MSAGRYAKIAGVGSALPSQRIPNSYFEDFVETSDEWIRDRTGIAARHFARAGESTSDFAAVAARSALEAAGVEPSKIDMLIVATLTPDRPLPSTAVMVQKKLEMSCPAFDVNAACSGFSYAMTIGTSMIESGNAENVVIVGAEILSRYLDMTDRGTCILFGDGAGAAVLSASSEAGVIGNVLEADGGASELLTIEAGGTVEPASEESVRDRRHFIRMPNGREVYKRAVLGMSEACTALLEKSGFSPDDVTLLVPHQANARIMSTVAERLGIPPERCALDVEDVGNTSAASIPIALDHAWRAGRVQPGALVLLTSFGAGLAWGANLVRWTAPQPH